MLLKMKRTLLILMTFVLIFSTAGIAGATEQAKSTSNSEIFEKIVEKTKKEYPNAVLKILTKEEFEKLMEKENNLMADKNKAATESVQIYGSAPPITYLNIYYVDSQSYEGPNGYQDVTSSSTTPYPVRGYTKVWTAVIGYGYNWKWLADELITSDNPDYYQETITIDTNGDSIVDGFWYIVGFDSDQKIPNGGQFKFQGKSYNSPWNTMIDTLNITHE